MKAKKVTRKEAKISDVGKALMESGNRSHLAMEEIRNLTLIVCTLPPFREEKHILAYRNFMQKTVKTKDETHIAENSKAYIAMLKAFRDRIVEDDLNWLQANQIVIKKAKTEAYLPLSEAYEWCLKNNEARLNDMEATLFLIFKFLDDEKLPDHGKLVAICAEFKKNDKEEAGKKAVQDIVNKVKQSAPQGNQAPNTQDVMKIVQAIVGGGANGEGSSMQDLAQSIMTGKMTIPDLVSQVKSVIETPQEQMKENVEVQDEDTEEE